MNNEPIIEEFRKNAGNVGGPFEGTALLLLHLTGAKSGKKYIKPLVYTKDGEHFIIVASKRGAPTNPDWYHNLRANPTTKIEVGTETFDITAREAEGDERQKLFEKHAAQYPYFNDYQSKTDRVIPVFVLSKV